VRTYTGTTSKLQYSL